MLWMEGEGERKGGGRKGERRKGGGEGGKRERGRRAGREAGMEISRVRPRPNNLVCSPVSKVYLV